MTQMTVCYGYQQRPIYGRGAWRRRHVSGKATFDALSAEQINQIHEYSLDILATTGVRVDSPRARAVFERVIGRVADG